MSNAEDPVDEADIEAQEADVLELVGDQDQELVARGNRLIVWDPSSCAPSASDAAREPTQDRS